MADDKKDASAEGDANETIKEEKPAKSPSKKEKTPAKEEAPAPKVIEKADKKAKEEVEMPEKDDVKEEPEEDLPKIKKLDEEKPMDEKPEETPEEEVKQDEPVTGDTETQAKPKTNVLLLLVIFLFLAAITLFTYWWKFMRVTNTASTGNTPTASTDVSASSVTTAKKNSKSTTAPSTTATTAASTKKSATFEEAVNAKDYNALKTTLATKVNFIMDATECCGNITADQTITQMKSRIEDVGIDTYNFSASQQIVKKMKVNLPQQFGKWNNIGIADGRNYLAYNTDSTGKVNDIIMGFTDNLDLE